MAETLTAEERAKGLTCPCSKNVESIIVAAIRAAEQAAVEREREECAQEADALAEPYGQWVHEACGDEMREAAAQVAARIRARSAPTTPGPDARAALAALLLRVQGARKLVGAQWQMAFADVVEQAERALGMSPTTRATEVERG